MASLWWRMVHKPGLFSRESLNKTKQNKTKAAIGKSCLQVIKAGCLDPHCFFFSLLLKIRISPLFILEWHLLKDTRTISHLIWVEFNSLSLSLSSEPGPFSLSDKNDTGGLQGRQGYKCPAFSCVALLVMSWILCVCSPTSSWGSGRLFAVKTRNEEPWFSVWQATAERERDRENEIRQSRRVFDRALRDRLLYCHHDNLGKTGEMVGVGAE